MEVPEYIQIMTDEYLDYYLNKCLRGKQDYQDKSNQFTKTLAQSLQEVKNREVAKKRKERREKESTLIYMGKSSFEFVYTCFHYTDKQLVDHYNTAYNDLGPADDITKMYKSIIDSRN